jgi:hypothetical protein
MSRFGSSVAGGGDTNLDGFTDVIVGAPAITGSSTETANVYRGSASGVVAAPSPTLGRLDAGQYGFAVALAAPVRRSLVRVQSRMRCRE